MDDGNQAIVVALDIKNRERVSKIRARQHGTNRVNIHKIGLLENLAPACQHFGSIGVMRRVAIQCFLFDDVHEVKYSN